MLKTFMAWFEGIRGIVMSEVRDRLDFKGFKGCIVRHCLG